MRNRHYILMAALAAVLLVPSLCICANDAQAQDIVVNVSTRKIALAVADPQPTAENSDAITQDVTSVLRNCLEIAGLFDLIHPNQFLPGLNTESLANTNYNNWHSSGADALIKVSYTKRGDSLDLSLRLYDIIESKPITLNYTAPGVSSTNYKPAVYAFVNAVIKYYSGADGIFGQNILAIRKARKGSSAVYKVSTDGSSVSAMYSKDTIYVLPAWGPSGGALYTSYLSGNPDLFLNGKRISTHPGLNSGAAYCPGNGKIALTLSKDGNSEIYTMNSDGSNLTRLTNSSAIDTSPTWGPGCSSIAFVSDRGGNPQIYIMGADGSGVRRLTTLGNYNTNPAWSHDNKIAFSARDERGGLDIFVINPDGSELTRITQNQGKNDSPSWSPDGHYLVFSSTRDGGSNLYISTSDGKAQTAITKGGGFESPAWQF